LCMTVQKYNETYSYYPDPSDNWRADTNLVAQLKRLLGLPGHLLPRDWRCQDLLRRAGIAIRERVGRPLIVAPEARRVQTTVEPDIRLPVWSIHRGGGIRTVESVSYKTGGSPAAARRSTRGVIAVVVTGRTDGNHHVDRAQLDITKGPVPSSIEPLERFCDGSPDVPRVDVSWAGVPSRFRVTLPYPTIPI
jgi:hypothetical protein